MILTVGMCAQGAAPDPDWILAFNDVPVPVGQHCSGVSIDANAEDQHTLGQPVAILNGRFQAFFSKSA